MKFEVSNGPSCLIQSNMEDIWTVILSYLQKHVPPAMPPFLRSVFLARSHTCYNFLQLKRKKKHSHLPSLQLLSHFLSSVSKFFPPISPELILIRLSPPPLHQKGDCQGHQWPPHCHIWWSSFSPYFTWSVRSHPQPSALQGTWSPSQLTGCPSVSFTGSASSPWPPNAGFFSPHWFSWCRYNVISWL